MGLGTWMDKINHEMARGDVALTISYLYFKLYYLVKTSSALIDQDNLK